jgi:hypothetical protein
MTELVACACGLDPAAESMAAQAGIALALSAPWWFRDQIREGIRRLRGKGPNSAAHPCSDDLDGPIAAD